jgi:hypothetical protein
MLRQAFRPAQSNEPPVSLFGEACKWMQFGGMHCLVHPLVLASDWH